MKALIFDYSNFKRAKGMAETLEGIGLSTYIKYQGKYYDKTGTPVKELGHVFALVLWHKTNAEHFTKEHHFDCPTISFSGGGDGDMPDSINATVAQHILDVLHDDSLPDSDVKKKEILSFWTNNERLYAFRLLCESVVLCKGTASGKVGDIHINAPTNLEQWLTPFSLAETDNDQKIEALIAIMGSDDARDAARRVLDQVKTNGDVLEAASLFPGDRLNGS